MKKGNVLITGVSGAGKSTLINGIMGHKVAKTVKGSAATQEITRYSSEDLKFNIYDSKGFEYNWFNQHKIVKEMQKLVKEGLRAEDPEAVINCIWYCVDATSGKLHEENIKSLKAIIKEWKNIPVIAVLTKSYSQIEKEENIQMVWKQFGKYGENIDLKAVIPVVAEPFPVDEGVVAPAYGMMTLIEKTNEILEVVDVGAEKEIFKNRQKRHKANLYVNATATMGAVVGAVPIQIADGVILTGIETGMITYLSKLYHISDSKEETAEEIMKALLEAGTAGFVAKAAVSRAKYIPGVGKVAAVVNAIVAFFIVELLGQASIALFENINSGKIHTNKKDEVIGFVEKYVLENAPEMFKVITEYVEKNKEKIDFKELGKLVLKKISSK